MRDAGGCRRNSSQRDQPAAMPPTALAGCGSVRSEAASLMLAMAWLWVSSKAPPAADQQGEHQRRPARVPRRPPTPHPPFEQGEHHGQQHEHPVLQHLDIVAARLSKMPSISPSGHDLRVGAQEQEHRQAQEDQRPVAGPAHAGLVQQRQQAASPARTGRTSDGCIPTRRCRLGVARRQVARAPGMKAAPAAVLGAARRRRASSCVLQFGSGPGVSCVGAMTGAAIPGCCGRRSRTR